MGKVGKLSRAVRSVGRSLFSPTPVQINLLPTYGCNLSCSYCDQFGEGSSMGWGLFTGVVDKADELHAALFNMTGGDPTVWEHLTDAIHHLTFRNFFSHLTTNGFLLDDELVDKLGEAQLDAINISLDGLTEISESNKTLDKHDTHFTARLQRLKRDYDVRVKINSVIQPGNIPQIPRLLAYAQKEGFIISLGLQVSKMRRGRTVINEPLPPHTLEVISEAAREGFLVEPPAYFTNPEFDCYEGKQRSLSVGPEGEIQYCFKTGTSPKSFLDFTKKDYPEYLRNLREHIDECTPSCVSNCGYMGAHYKEHPLNFVQLALRK